MSLSQYVNDHTSQLQPPSPMVFSVMSGSDFLGEIKISHAKLQDYANKEPLWWELKEKAHEQEGSQLVGFIKITTHYKVRPTFAYILTAKLGNCHSP